jgi:hypothetical protein
MHAHAWPSSSLAGYSLDLLELKIAECAQLRGDHVACEEAGCNSRTSGWDGSGPFEDHENHHLHFCGFYSHHGITSKAIAKKAAEEMSSKAVDAAQDAVDTACATSATSLACAIAKQTLADATDALDRAIADLENDDGAIADLENDDGAIADLENDDGAIADLENDDGAVAPLENDDGSGSGSFVAPLENDDGDVPLENDDSATPTSAMASFVVVGLSAVAASF